MLANRKKRAKAATLEYVDRPFQVRVFELHDQIEVESQAGKALQQHRYATNDHVPDRSFAQRPEDLFEHHRQYTQRIPVSSRAGEAPKARSAVEGSPSGTAGFGMGSLDRPSSLRDSGGSG